MPDARWERIWEVFHGALEKPRAERTTFVAVACGDDTTLRGEVERLLEAHDHTSAFMDTPAAGAGFDAEPAPAPGQRVGPYRLLRPIGEGGMGVVYEAEQERPLRRRVALKLIKPGMDTREVIARFESERQALALMQHPHIAQVFDAGATEQGRSYFVMEHVGGVPITTYCDARRLGLRERLRLFASVCEAVQHAHQKGVIHRDVKPSNVLVAEEDGRPVAKVIDFGIAKATGGGPGGAPRVTVMGSFMGTPEYMSPEQAAGTGLDVDTRTDVYSLGVLLYELLSGRLPFPPSTFAGGSLGDIQRIIREEEPPRLAAGLAALPAPDAERVAAARGSDARALRRRLRGDLEWIAARAMEKDRARRYATASELAADLERHLAGQPVAAGPPGRAYRLRKFVRRHRLGVAAGSALALALIAFGLATAVQSARTARALERAERERETARRTAAFLVDIFKQSDPNTAKGQQATAREILDRGASRLQVELKGEPEVRASLLHTVGGIYRTLGLPDRAQPLVEEAVALRRQALGNDHPLLAESLVLLGLLRFDLARDGEAEALMREALELRRRVLGPAHASVAEPLDGLGVIAARRADHDGAESLYRQALAVRRASSAPDTELAESLNNLAAVLIRKGDYAGALPLNAEAVESLRRAHGDDHVDVAIAKANLAHVHMGAGDHEAAVRLLREVVAARRKLLGDAHPSLASPLNSLGQNLSRLGRDEEAEPHIQEALAIARARHAANHPQLLMIITSYGGFLLRRGDLARSQPLLEEALALHRAAGAAGASAHANRVYLGLLHALRGDFVRAEPLCREGLEMRRRARRADTGDVADALACQGGALVGLRRHAEAEPALREAIALRRQAPVRDAGALALAEALLGAALAGQRRFPEAEPLLLGGLAGLRERYGPRHPQTLWAQRLAGQLHRN